MEGSRCALRPCDFRGLTLTEFRQELRALASSHGWSLYVTAKYLREHPESDLRVMQMASLVMAEGR